MTNQEILELENKLRNENKRLLLEKKLCLKFVQYSPQQFENKECVMWKEKLNEKE